MRFGITKKWGSYAGSCTVLLLGMSLTTIVTMLVYAAKSLATYLSDSTDAVRLTDPMLLLYDFLFLLLQIALATVPAILVSAFVKGVKPNVLAAISAALIFLSSVSLEFFDTVLPFFAQGSFIAEDVLNLVITLIIYIIHALLGYITCLSFLKNRNFLKLGAKK